MLMSSQDGMSVAFNILMPGTLKSLAKGITDRMIQVIEDTGISCNGCLHINAAIEESRGNENVDKLLQKLESHVDEMKKNEKSIYISLA